MSSGMRTAAIEADAAAVVDGAGVDVGGLALHGDQQPGHGVDEHHDAAADGEQHEADAHPRDVDPGGRRDRAADAAEHPVVRAPAQGCAASGRRGGGAGGWRSVRPGPATVRPVPVRSDPAPRRAAPTAPWAGPSARARPARLPSGGHPPRADACRDRVPLRYPMIARAAPVAIRDIPEARGSPQGPTRVLPDSRPGPAVRLAPWTPHPTRPPTPRPPRPTGTPARAHGPRPRRARRREQRLHRVGPRPHARRRRRRTGRLLRRRPDDRPHRLRRPGLPRRPGRAALPGRLAAHPRRGQPTSRSPRSSLARERARSAY